MPISRRLMLQLAAMVPVPGLAMAQGAVSLDAALSERSIGSKDAKVVVAEYYSLTCPHCAAFFRDTMPKVHTDLIDTGKMRMVFQEFPLDRLALAASAVARSLPPDRYEPFVGALLASQARWAFARGVDNINELWKMAALAGMSRATFDAAVADKALQDAILKAQDAAQAKLGVDSTPTFIFNGPGLKDEKKAGDLPFDTFAGLVAKAAG